MSSKNPEQSKKLEWLRDSFRRVENFIEVQAASEDESQTTPGPFARSLMLDAAKIALQCELEGYSDDSLKEKKLRFAKQAIMLDPENAELWVHLHLCLTS